MKTTSTARVTSTHVIVTFTAALTAGFVALPASAQPYPSRPVRLVIPFVAGSSSNDMLGRSLAQKLGERLGQQVVVDNRPGAGGNVGSEHVAKSPPDGYTLLLGVNGPLAIGPSVYEKLGYDPVRDLATIARFAMVPYTLALHPSVPANNVKELIALAKAKPGGVLFASAGNGSTPHLCGEMINLVAGVKMTHVPYKSGAPAVTDLTGGQVQMYCVGITAVIQLVKAGRLKAIAATSATRSPMLPDMPTVAESGLPGFDVSSWIGVLAPAKTPPAIIKTLYDHIAAITNEPEMRKTMLEQGSEPGLLNPEQFSAYLKSEIEKWGKVVKAAGVKPD